MELTTEKKKRVFVGIKISKDLTERLRNWKANYHNLPVRWIEDKDLHITLIPPWYENEQGLDKVAKILKSAVMNYPPFEITFKNISFGPNINDPRLIWVEGKTNEKLIHLKKYLGKTFSLREEKRIFLPHITIARLDRRNLNRLGARDINEKVFWKEAVEKITLFESKLSPKGADYEIIKSFGLYKEA